jgi:hypothetical protein
MTMQTGVQRASEGMRKSLVLTYSTMSYLLFLVLPSRDGGRGLFHTLLNAAPMSCLPVWCSCCSTGSGFRSQWLSGGLRAFLARRSCRVFSG